MSNLSDDAEPKVERRCCPLWLSERNVIIVLYNIPIFFVGIWLWSFSAEVRCSHARLQVLVNSIITVTLCVWWPSGIDVYYGIPRPEPTTYERRRDFAVFVFALVVAAGMGWGMQPKCGWEVHTVQSQTMTLLIQIFDSSDEIETASEYDVPAYRIFHRRDFRPPFTKSSPPLHT